MTPHSRITMFHQTGAALLVAATLAGCATKEAVTEQTEPIRSQLGTLEQSLSEAARLAQNTKDQVAASQMREEALLRAVDALTREMERLQNQLAETVSRQEQAQAGLRSSLNQAESRLTSQGERLESLSARGQEQAAALVDLQGALARVGSRMDELTTHAQELDARASETLRQTGELREHLGQAAQLRQGALERLAALEAGLGTGLAGAESARQSLSTRVDERLGDLARRMTVQEGQVNELKDVSARLGSTEQRLDTLATVLPARLSQMESEMGTLATLAQGAMELAAQEEIRAKGKVAFSVLLTEDKTLYPLNLSSLGSQDRAVLSDLVTRLGALDTNYHLEIEGHTDNIGVDDYNYHLGKARAEVVKRYLHETENIALSKMSVISYGATQPTDRHSRNNRRILIKVLVLDEK